MPIYLIAGFAHLLTATKGSSWCDRDRIVYPSYHVITSNIQKANLIHMNNSCFYVPKD